MSYSGEHLLPGLLGHFFIYLSLVASGIATFSYFLSARSSDTLQSNRWKKLARGAFLIEVFSVFAIFGILFYIISNHLFEYKYAWQHSSRSLEVKYLLSCFWEGQEGSFLLWSIWHSVLGLILMRTSKKWEAPVMTVLSFAQLALATMLAGMYIFGWKMGSNPFILLRDSGVLDNAPALHINGVLRPDYMNSITDGNDLNPLLQNYWMVIHPPVLFLGFASTIVPFAFTIAGLWTKKFGEWTKPALPWAQFSAAVLGVGIMMGAKWAYESLTFGGYWAWDPVENAALVPWLIMIAGIHTLLIYKHSGHSLRTTHLFFILSFVFILYSTFLTRSGILGDTSVHAFTDLGMNFQLLAFLLIFTIPSIAFFIYRAKEIPMIRKEESGSSREFWMFIGSLVFFLSAIVIIGKTSLPVYNKLFGTNKATPEDPEYSYNQIQVFVAIIIGLLTAVTQYLKYKNTSGKYFWKKIGLPVAISLVGATLILAFGDINYTKKTQGFMAAIWIAVACSFFAIVANISYIWLGVKGSLKLSGGSVSHAGFGMVLLGILISASKKETLSYNTSPVQFEFLKESKEVPGENLTLIKGVRTDMDKYWVTYESDSAHPRKQLWFYNIRFKKKDGKEEFVLQPNAFVNYKGNEGLMANPSSRHYWDHDVFTYITSLPNPDKMNDTAKFKSLWMKVGDTSMYSGGYFILEKISTRDHIPNSSFKPTDSATVASLKIHSIHNTTYESQPLLIKSSENLYINNDTVVAENLIFRINQVEGERVELGIKESNSIMKYVTLKAYKFPFINLLWLGILVTATGILMSMVRRIRANYAIRVKAD